MKFKLLWNDSTSHLEREINDFLKEIGTGAQIHTLIMTHQQISENVLYHFASILYKPGLSDIPQLPPLEHDPHAGINF